MPGIHTYNSYLNSHEDDFASRTKARLNGVEGKDVDIHDAQFKDAINSAALSNSDRQAQALSRADGFSYQVAHPEIKLTDKHIKLITHYCATQGISDPTYPQIADAVDMLVADGHIIPDKSVRPPKTFRGVISSQTYDSVDSLIAQERQAALSKVERTHADELLDNMPLEQLQARIKNEFHQEEVRANSLNAEKNAQAWATLNPWYTDTVANGKLILTQLKANGVREGLATIEQIDHATNQLRASGLLQINPKAVAKQQAAEIAALAKEHAAKTFNEQDAYDNLSMEELRDRANAQLAAQR